jgi:hypothetical protein
MLQKTIFGFRTRRSSYPTPRRANAPGRMASTTTSAPVANSFRMATPASVRRSSTSERFPRLTCRFMRDVPSTMGHVISRM